MPKKQVRIKLGDKTYGIKKNSWQGKIFPRKTEEVWSRIPENDGTGPYNKLFAMIASHPNMKGKKVEERRLIIGQVMKEVNRRLDDNTLTDKADIEKIIVEWTTKDLHS